MGMRCNSQLLRSIRHELGWTQERLAGQSGLCVRVIAKAESAEIVSPRTVDSIIGAITRAGVTISVGDLIGEPKELGRAFLANYSAFGADLIRQSLDILAPDIEVSVRCVGPFPSIVRVLRGVDDLDSTWRDVLRDHVRVAGEQTIDWAMRVCGGEVIAWGNDTYRAAVEPPLTRCLFVLQMRFDAGRMRSLNAYGAAFPVGGSE